MYHLRLICIVGGRTSARKSVKTSIIAHDQPHAAQPVDSIRRWISAHSSIVVMMKSVSMACGMSDGTVCGGLCGGCMRAV